MRLNLYAKLVKIQPRNRRQIDSFLLMHLIDIRFTPYLNEMVERGLSRIPRVNLRLSNMVL